MANEKKVYSATDAQPIVLYAKKDPASELAYPILVDSNGALIISGLVPKEYDYIDLSPPSQPTTITFKLGGISGTVVATLTITYSGSDIATVSRS